MWIRSQDRQNLMYCTDIRILGTSSSIWDFTKDEKLGEYETKERAKEVLDNIQNKIITLEQSKLIGDVNLNSVFQMPEK